MTSSNPNNPGQQGTQPDLNSSDPYAVLGTSRNASRREIKRAYFSLVREYPPETHAEAFKKIRAAYEKLRTADSKAKTDLFLFRPPSPWQPRKRLGKLDLSFYPEDMAHTLQQYGDLGLTDFQSDFRPVKL